MTRKVPVLFERKELCCGCSACYTECPRHAIRMVEDKEGFDYPQIKEELCIGCNNCIKVCPIKK